MIKIIQTQEGPRPVEVAYPKIDIAPNITPDITNTTLISGKRDP
jgi:hypothetical protein